MFHSSNNTYYLRIILYFLVIVFYCRTITYQNARAYAENIVRNVKPSPKPVIYVFLIPSFLLSSNALSYLENNFRTYTVIFLDVLFYNVYSS